MTLVQSEPKKIYIRVDVQGWQPGPSNIVYFPLDDNLKDYTDTYTLTANGASITTIDGVKCLDCTSGYANCAISTLPQGAAARTNMFWLRVASSSWGNPYEYGSYNSYRNLDGVYRDGSSGLNWQCYGYGLGTNFFPTVGTWCHVALARDASNNMQIYINGTQVKTGNVTFNTNGTTLYLGSSTVGDHILNGYLGSFIVENKARTAQEVSDYYNLTKSLYGIS